MFDDGRGDEDHEIALGPRCGFFLKQITEERDIPGDWNFSPALGSFILQQSANCQRVTAANQDV